MLGAAAFFLMSILIHFPINNSPRYYSDIIDTFWYGRVNANNVPYVVSGIPYVTYNFEYPSICGLILWLGGWLSGGSVTTYAIVEFGTSFIFFIALTHITFQFLEYLNLGHTKQLIFSVFAPSILLYGAYNYDTIQTFLVIAALYLFVARSKIDLSAIMIGLSVATKLTPLFLMPLFWQELRGFEKRLRFTLIAAGAWAVPNVPFMVANFGYANNSGWYYSYHFLQTWGLEDTFLVWIFPNNTPVFAGNINFTWWTVAKDISLALVALTALVIYFYFNKKSLLTRAFLITGLTLLFSYIAAPQLNLNLLPFLALVPVVPLTLFYLFDITNVMIILTWFMIPNSHPTLPGLVQTFALLRQIYLAFMMGLVALSKSFRPKS